MEYDYFKSNIEDVKFDNFKKYCEDKYLNYHKMLAWKYNPNRCPRVYKLDRTLTMTEDTLWFLGLFLADGWVDNSKHRKSIHITIENDSVLIEKTMKIIKNELYITPNIRYIKDQESCEIYFTHQLLSEMLSKEFYNSIKHYSHTKCIPLWIKNTGKNNIIAFIKGYFIGDGCFYDEKGSCFFSMSTVSKQLRDDLNLLFMFIGILPSKSFNDRGKYGLIQGRKVKVKPAYLISISGEQIKKLLYMFNMKSSGYESKNRYQKFFEDTNNWYVPITEISSKEYSGKVCNLEVEKDHSYLVSGGLSAHNCVYTGKDGNYTEYSDHDATDIYGISKSLGEPEDATTIRTSIIGEELYNFC